MIRLNHVTKTYSGSNTTAVDDLSLEIKDGEIFGFLGPNGAGKSTTIKMITGILTPSEGTIEVGGVNIAENANVFSGCAEASPYDGAKVMYTPSTDDEEFLQNALSATFVGAAKNKK